MKKSGLTKSIRNAVRGGMIVLRTEPNFRIQLYLSVLAIVVASLLQVRVWEFVLVILLASSVLVLEIFNSVIERMTDGLNPRLKPIARDVKDLMASSVLFVAIVAGVVGLIIFLPYFVELFRA